MRKLLATTMICSLAAGGAFAQTASDEAAPDTQLQQTAPAATDDGAAAVTDTEATDTAATEEAAKPVEETDTAATEDTEAEPADAATDTAATDATDDAADGTLDTDTAATEAPAADAEGTDVASSESVVREQTQNELRLDWITGTNVKSPDGETIGDINDVIVDGETGELTAAVLSVGGFLGIGSKQIAVDWSKLKIDYDANEISSDLTREEAEAAPEYAFRDQEQPPAPAMDTGTGMGTTGTGMGSGTTQLN